MPLLDTRLLSRLASGTKQESYWPVAVAQNKFHCIILKGADKNPYFPRSILSEFEFQIPVSGPPSGKGEGDDGEVEREQSDQQRIEEVFVRSSVMHALQSDTISVTRATPSQRHALAALEGNVNKSLLQLLALECLAGEEHGMKALEIVGLLRDDGSGKILGMAEKVADRYHMDVLREKIRELAERRLVGLDVDDELE